MRGEYVKAESSAAIGEGSPPLARGVQRHNKWCKLKLRITPACAGSTRSLVATRLCAIGSPPLARGVPSQRKRNSQVHGITPACAGSTRLIYVSIWFQKDHPRLRGEYCSKRNSPPARLGSPPLARGVRKLIRRELQQRRITPACAGSTKAHELLQYKRQDHPRLRGEYNKRG